MWRRIWPCEYVWRSVSDLETSQRKPCQCPLPCPGYSRLQQFSWQPADKGALRISTICSLSLSPFILSHPSQFFLLISHLSLLLLTSFKQTQKKRCWTQLLAQNPLIYVLPYSSDTLECVRGCVSVCVRAVCSLSFYLNEWAVLHPVRLWFG